MKSSKSESPKSAAKTTQKSAASPVDQECERLVALIPEMEARLYKADGRYKTLKKNAMSEATRFEWSERPRYTERPLSLERGGRKPGRLLKEEPVYKYDMYRSGLAKDGRVMFEECYGREGVVNVKFWEYDGARVDTAYFVLFQSSPAVNVTSTFYKDGHPTGQISYATGGLSVEVYESEEGLITKAHLWAKQHESSEGRDVFQLIYTDEISYSGREIDEIVRVWATGGRETVFTQKKKEAKLDLQMDFADVHSYLSERVKAFKPAKHKGPGKSGPIERIQIGYECAQTGWVALIFDTRPGAEFDGEWTLYIEENHLPMPHWKTLSDANDEKSIKLVKLDGKETSLRKNTGFTTMIGEMLKVVLLEARDEGLFEKLPKSVNCVMDIEHDDGVFGETGIPAGEAPASPIKKGRRKASK